ncbi:MAG TPA: hypothetical protein PKI11_07140 [Candidatus Hydrogenedentes bacterium]|nr:hypothetical protein [Candidatus Hydrogenedentota bacterium]HNT89210.1 hypothetical protein [Candidatus Hydrogenedentota bacterium]
MFDMISRRTFLHGAMAASTGAAMGFGFEDRILLARAGDTSAERPVGPETSAMPRGKIGDLEVSRLICGGNLISGFAHSRDLIYVSKLLREYFTDDKVLETFQRCEESGINTALLRLDNDTLRILDKHWKERGGRLQWIAQVKPRERDLFTDIDRAVDHGAAAVYIQGETGDRFVEQGWTDKLGETLARIKSHGVPAGMGAHKIDVLHACVNTGIAPDFYMKTFNAKSYWSAGPMPRNDSVWEETPEETTAFFQGSKAPWIAFKVLGAGAIHPREGFQYAFEHGADFICVGMFDFQVREDAAIAVETLALLAGRERPWCA